MGLLGATGPGEDRLDTPQLMAEVYDELRALAADYLKRERPGHTLQPTALVHEAYLRLAGLDRLKWRGPEHFQAAAAGTIRRVLVDHARGRNASKRGGGGAGGGGGGRRRITLGALEGLPPASTLDLLALDEALEKLAALDARKARVVELRFFGGLTIDDTALALGVGTTTVEDDWAFARSWLRRELREP
jgi:RNA polymerase sigma factor (TIGR02999 family)